MELLQMAMVIGAVQSVQANLVISTRSSSLKRRPRTAFRRTIDLPELLFAVAAGAFKRLSPYLG
jgi:hypothetical protein